MTDEVTPTREQCVEWLNAMIEMRTPDLPPLMHIDAVPKAILSHLRTPRVEAERLEQIKREGYKPESGRARHLLRHAVLSEAVRKHMGEFWVDDVSLLLSRRPSEAVVAAGAWVPWKPGDALPEEGLYWCAINHGHGYWVCDPSMFEKQAAIAYWSIQLHWPYTPSPPEGGRT